MEEQRKLPTAAEALSQAAWVCFLNGHCSDLRVLAAIGSTCKTCRDTVKCQVLHEYQLLLPVAAPMYTTTELQQHHVDGLAWVTSIVGQQKLLAAVAEKQRPAVAFIMHDVPPEAAQQILRAGFRFSSEQLAAAARCRVSGLEVWIQEAKQLGKYCLTDATSQVLEASWSGMPFLRLLEAICCGNMVVLGALQPVAVVPASIIDSRWSNSSNQSALPIWIWHSLLIAVNSKSSGAAALLLDLLQESILKEAESKHELLFDLLAAAAVRGHRDVIIKLSQIPALQYARRHTLPEHRQLVKTLRVAAGAVQEHSQPDTVNEVGQLLEIHTMALKVAELEYARAMTLLTSDNDLVVAAICEQQEPNLLERLSDEDARTLLRQAVKKTHSSSTRIKALCRLRSGTVVHDVQELLRLSLESGLGIEVLHELLKLGSQNSVSNNLVVELLKSSFSKNLPGLVSSTTEQVAVGLLGLPISRIMAAADIDELMTFAVSSGSVQGLAKLLKLPAATSISRPQLLAAMGSILDRAVITESEADTAAAQLDVLCKVAMERHNNWELLNQNMNLVLLTKVFQSSYSCKYLPPLGTILEAQQSTASVSASLWDMAVGKLHDAQAASSTDFDDCKPAVAAEAVLVLALVPAVAHGVPVELLSAGLSTAVSVLHCTTVDDCNDILDRLINCRKILQPLQVETLFALLRLGIGAGDLAGSGRLALSKLYESEAARNLSGVQIAELINLAVSNADNVALEALCNMENPMSQLDAETVSGWIFSAIESFADLEDKPNDGNLFVRYLCSSSPGMRYLDAGTVLGLLHLAVQSQDVVAVVSLCGVPAAWSLDAQQVSGLLRAAMDEGCCHEIKEALRASLIRN